MILPAIHSPVVIQFRKVCYRRFLTHLPLIFLWPVYNGRLFVNFLAPVVHHPVDPCIPSPCGANAVCKTRNGAGSCICLPEYYGDPYTGCRPECVTNSDCDRSKACLNNKCRDPCPGTCGLNAECRVVNHSPSCSCLPGYIGDPITACHLVPHSKHDDCVHFLHVNDALKG